MAALSPLRLPASSLDPRLRYPSTQDLSAAHEGESPNKSDIDIRLAAVVISPPSPLKAARNYLKEFAGQKIDTSTIQKIRNTCLVKLSPPLDTEKQRFYNVVDINCNAMVEMLQSSPHIYFPKKLAQLAYLMAHYPRTTETFDPKLLSRCSLSHIIFANRKLTHLVAKKDSSEEREIRALFLLPPHPNIISFYGVLPVQMDSSGIRTVGIRFSPGGDLFAHLEAIRLAGCYLPLMKLYVLASQLSSAVLHLHENRVVHCDIKPENFVLDEKIPHVKLIDFETSRKSNEQAGYRGTARYLCPEHVEQYLSKEVVLFATDPSRDIWCLGHVFASLLQPDFNDIPGELAQNTQVTDAEIPPLLQDPHLQQNMYHIIDEVIAAHPHTGKTLEDFGALIKHCLSVNPQERPSASDVDKETKKILASLTKESVREETESPL